MPIITDPRWTKVIKGLSRAALEGLELNSPALPFLFSVKPKPETFFQRGLGWLRFWMFRPIRFHFGDCREHCDCD